jgi:hypothetical protein
MVLQIIGAIDCEMFTVDGVSRIYALGFKTNLDNKTFIYYIDKETLDSSNIVLAIIDEMLRPKYERVTFYCHNLGGYDVVFILNILLEYNDNHSEKDGHGHGHYKTSFVWRDNKIIYN